MEPLEEEFTTPENVRKWLVDDRRVPEQVAGTVAPTLFEGGYIYPSSLVRITRNDLDSLDISPPHKNVLFNKLQQQQQQPPWYKVSGAISRPVSHAGARLELYKLASAHNGLYPPCGKGVDKRSAILTSANGELDRSVINFSVVFRELGQASQFINGIWGRTKIILFF